MTQTSDPKRRRSLILFVLLIVAIAAAIRFLPRGGAIDGQAVSAQFSRAVAALEDQDLVLRVGDRLTTGYELAEELLADLSTRFPNDPAIARNAAILSVLRYEDSRSGLDKWSADELSAYRERMNARLTALAAFPEEQAIASYLKARVELKESGEVATESIVTLLQEAIRLRPDELAFRGQLAVALEQVSSMPDAPETWRTVRTEAIDGALELDSANVFLQGQQLIDRAEREDAGVIETAATLREMLGPMREPLVSVGNVGELSDPTVWLERIARENDPTRALAPAFRAVNLIKAETFGTIYFDDSNRAEGHPLDFVALEPSESLRKRFAAPADAAETKIAPTWAPAETLLDLGEPILDVEAIDVDLDRELDLVALTAGRIVVSLRRDGAERSRLELPIPASLKARRLMAVDLDQDDLAKKNDDDSADMSGMDAMPMPEESGEVDPEALAAERANRYFEADPDFVVLGEGGIAIVLNADDLGTNRRLELLQQIDAPSGATFSDAVPFDFDHDADIDLLVAGSDGIGLLMNPGTGRMIDVASFSPTIDGAVAPGLQAFDWDRDLDIDVVATVDGRPWLIENVLYGRFRPRPLEELGPRESVSGLVVLEADGIPSWDVAFVEGDAAKIGLTRTSPQGVTLHKELASDGAALAMATTDDLDDDGVQDLIGLSDDVLRLAIGRPAGGFEAPVDLIDGVAGYRMIDFDDDGRLDAIVAGPNGIRRVRNTTSTDAGWWQLMAIGSKDNSGRVNRDGIGTLVELVADGRYQAKVVRGHRTHFGLGDAERVPVARLLWPNGSPQGIIDPKRNTAHVEPIYLKGSCPFLYTWDGEKFVFVTDCLWAAPIGLQSARGQLMPSREWEYLKVPGEMLRASDDGRYRIRLTEELWESAYFDRVQLTAVDHPAEVEIYTNEKVGPDFIALQKIHTVSQRRVPSAARGTDGSDVSALVATADGDFYRGFDRTIVQGLTDEHFLELDLGDLSDAKQVTLFLTGWLHPTDSSLNVSFTDHPTRDAPRAPELQVPDGNGGWRAIETPMGFPGGKTKTIAVDLAPLLPTADGRLRIVTTAELYWDEAFFTVDEPPAEVVSTDLVMLAADLRYRGFSEREPIAPNSPERFRYDRVSTEPAWPPMRGRMTGYGDVLKLLAKADDRMVVMAAGDEIDLVFDVSSAPPLPEGWKRDFVLHSVGWDKDADLNTIFGQSTEPLPFGGMRSYPYAPEDKDWSTEPMREYLQEHQRRQARWFEFWSEPFRTLEKSEP